MVSPFDAAVNRARSAAGGRLNGPVVPVRVSVGNVTVCGNGGLVIVCCLETSAGVAWRMSELSGLSTEIFAWSAVTVIVDGEMKFMLKSFWSVHPRVMLTDR